MTSTWPRKLQSADGITQSTSVYQCWAAVSFAAHRQVQYWPMLCTGRVNGETGSCVLSCQASCATARQRNGRITSAEPKPLINVQSPLGFLSHHPLLSMSPHLVIFWRCRAEICVAVHDFDQNSHPTSSHPGLLFSSGQDACLRPASP